MLQSSEIVLFRIKDFDSWFPDVRMIFATKHGTLMIQRTKIHQSKHVQLSLTFRKLVCLQMADRCQNKLYICKFVVLLVISKSVWSLVSDQIASVVEISKPNSRFNTMLERSVRSLENNFTWAIRYYSKIIMYLLIKDAELTQNASFIFI